jgi:hypothetical protein
MKMDGIRVEKIAPYRFFSIYHLLFNPAWMIIRHQAAEAGMASKKRIEHGLNCRLSFVERIG